MAKVIHRPCGTDVHGETDDELVAAVEQHDSDRDLRGNDRHRAAGGITLRRSCASSGTG
jgi:hypothetical protein